MWSFLSLWNLGWVPSFTSWKQIPLVWLCSAILIRRCSHGFMRLAFSFHGHCLIGWSSSSVVFMEFMEKKNSPWFLHAKDNDFASPWFLHASNNDFDRMELTFRSVFPWPKIWSFKVIINCLHFRKKFAQEVVSLSGKLHVKGGDGFLEFVASEKSLFALKKNLVLFHLFYFILLETSVTEKLDFHINFRLIVDFNKNAYRDFS